MNRLLWIVIAIFLVGCASNPQPRVLVNHAGQPVMVLGDSCDNPVRVSDTFISCLDEDGEPVGYIAHISNEEYNKWRRNEAVRAQQAQARSQAWSDLADTISEASAKINAQNQQLLSQMGQINTPEVAQPMSGMNGITYTQVGDSLLGSNGISYRKVGNTVLGSDGTRCQIAGSVIVCR